MSVRRLAIIALNGLAAAACSQSDSGNVMASNANALTPAQVDLALGNEALPTDGDLVANEANSLAVSAQGNGADRERISGGDTAPADRNSNTE